MNFTTKTTSFYFFTKGGDDDHETIGVPAP